MKIVRRPNVILVGNGIARTFVKGAPDWNELIPACDDSLKMSVPMPLRASLMSKEEIGDVCKKLSKAVKFKDGGKECLKHLADLKIDSILTTNFSYELEYALINNFGIGKRKDFTHSKLTKKDANDRYLLHTYYSLDCGIPLWHIHGEAGRKTSVILSHGFYGSILSAFNEQFKNFKNRWGKFRKNSDKTSFNYLSWIDYFMLGNIYVFSFGFDLSELDLWFLLSCRKTFKDRGRATFFHPSKDKNEEALPAKLKLLNNFDFDCKEIKCNDYAEFYSLVTSELQSSLRNEEIKIT